MASRRPAATFGALEDEPRLVFAATRDAAETFVKADPFVAHGVVAR
jgi:uncharacterized protein YciI